MAGSSHFTCNHTLYLADDCQLVSDVRSRQLRSSDSMTCAVRRPTTSTRTTYGDRCFAGPRV